MASFLFGTKTGSGAEVFLTWARGGGSFERPLRPHYSTELGTLEWWISELKLNPLFFLISRLDNPCSPLVINLQINAPIGIKDISF